MSSDLNNFVIDEFPSKVSKKTAKGSNFLDNKQNKHKLPDKDRRFMEEFKKNLPETRASTFKPAATSLVSGSTNKLRGVSVNAEKTRRERKLGKYTTSTDFKSTQGLKETQRMNLPILSSTSALEKKSAIDLSYKFFVGPGNNDTLVRNILSRKIGWIKTFTPHSANLIWTQVKEQSMFDLIPSGSERKPKKSDDTRQIYSYEGDASSQPQDRMKVRIYNKLEWNKELASKKRLFYNMTAYYKSAGENPFKYIPLTFHIQEGAKDPTFADFVKKFNEFQREIPNDPHLNNCWIVKPGESTNRGIGITVCSSIEEVSKAVDEKVSMGSLKRTYIVQKYLYKPMLYLNRKFDIRCYTLVTIVNGLFNAYFYKEGYMRTSCQEFNMANIKDRFIHLTNDAVQKNSPNYGRFEDGNKLSYDDFQDYINTQLPNKINFKVIVYPKIRKIVQDTIKATYKKLDTRKRNHTFEILGYDFMLDEIYNPWLLEVNTNPCLALSGQYLASLIPAMLSDAFSIVLDPLFPIENPEASDNINRFELVYSHRR